MLGGNALLDLVSVVRTVTFTVAKVNTDLNSVTVSVTLPGATGAPSD